MTTAMIIMKSAARLFHRRFWITNLYMASVSYTHLDVYKRQYESCPGVSACFGAAASLNIEYTLPGISQSLIITRMEGRTKVPPKESIASFASHHASMAIYLSTGLLEKLTESLIEGGYAAETPAAIVYKATWPRCV